jgi:hypothetical protein
VAGLPAQNRDDDVIGQLFSLDNGSGSEPTDPRASPLYQNLGGRRRAAYLGGHDECLSIEPVPASGARALDMIGAFIRQDLQAE